jgi:protein-disulfide isomerase
MIIIYFITLPLLIINVVLWCQVVVYFDYYISFLQENDDRHKEYKRKYKTTKKRAYITLLICILLSIILFS